MCQPKTHFSFCTCELDSDVSSLDNYWILYRPNNNMEVFVIGQCFIPFPFQNKKRQDIEKQLLSDLNEQTSFDKDIKFIKEDLMVIKLYQIGPENEQLEFQFEYKRKRWRVLEDFESQLDFQNGFDLILKGQLKSS